MLHGITGQGIVQPVADGQKFFLFEILVQTVGQHRLPVLFLVLLQFLQVCFLVQQEITVLHPVHLPLVEVDVFVRIVALALQIEMLQAILPFGVRHHFQRQGFARLQIQRVMAESDIQRKIIPLFQRKLEYGDVRGVAHPILLKGGSRQRHVFS